MYEVIPGCNVYFGLAVMDDCGSMYTVTGVQESAELIRSELQKKYPDGKYTIEQVLVARLSKLEI